jgi:hypothetical protein
MAEELSDLGVIFAGAFRGIGDAMLGESEATEARQPVPGADAPIAGIPMKFILIGGLLLVGIVVLVSLRR